MPVIPLKCEYLISVIFKLYLLSDKCIRDSQRCLSWEREGEEMPGRWEWSVILPLTALWVKNDVSAEIPNQVVTAHFHLYPIFAIHTVIFMIH